MNLIPNKHNIFDEAPTSVITMLIGGLLYYRQHEENIIQFFIFNIFTYLACFPPFCFA